MAAWARRVRRTWPQPDDPGAGESEVERLERELLDERRKVVERDITIAELRARLEPDAE